MTAMGLGRVASVGIHGFTASVIDIQASTGSGLPGIFMSGGVDAAIRESKDRIRAAIVNSDYKVPNIRYTIGFAPANQPKTGSGYDLPAALAMLQATGQVAGTRMLGTVFLGELALDGTLRPVRGVLPALVEAQRHGYRRAVVPRANVTEAALVGGLEIGGAATLSEVVRWLDGDLVLDTVNGDEPAAEPPAIDDLADVAGQSAARHALEIAAAGAHHVLMTGPPGIGKTMLARRLPGILPPLAETAALEVTAIHSIAGTLSPGSPLVSVPPFISPHHSTSTTALVGGGSGVPRPGAVSLAHRGVLFLDECPEMGAKTLDSLRQPLEEGKVHIRRSLGAAYFPARFQLVLAANPCPCAPAQDIDCICSSQVRRRYLGKLSGPLMDRVDIRVHMDPPGNTALMDEVGESSAAVAARVATARAAAQDRWRDHGWLTNAEVPGSALRQRFRLPPADLRPIELYLRDGRITARGADRALRLAWTLSDLRGADRPTEDDVAEALLYRDRGSS